MARAAAELSVTQPAVSLAIAELESSLNVRLLDRGSRGVKLTSYGQALISRGNQMLDCLSLAVRDLDYLSKPGKGTIIVGADMHYIAGGVLGQVIQELCDRHPQLSVHVVETTTRAIVPDFRELRERQVDLMLGRLSHPMLDDELEAEMLMEEELLVVARAHHPLAKRRRLSFETLADQAWILASADNLARSIFEKAFLDSNLTPPQPRVVTYSIQLRMQLLERGQFLTVMPDTAFANGARRWNLRVLPVKFAQRLPVVAVRVKNRTLTPSVELFLESVRTITRRLAGKPRRMA